MFKQKPAIPLGKKFKFISECKVELKKQNYDLVLDIKGYCYRFNINGATYAVLGGRTGGIILDSRGMFEEQNESEEHKKVRECLEGVVRKYISDIDYALVSERSVPFSQEEKEFFNSFPGHTSDYPV